MQPSSATRSCILLCCTPWLRRRPAWKTRAFSKLNWTLPSSQMCQQTRTVRTTLHYRCSAADVYTQSTTALACFVLLVGQALSLQA
jgi:hypothetical protein